MVNSVSRSTYHVHSMKLFNKHLRQAANRDRLPMRLQIYISSLQEDSSRLSEKQTTTVETSNLRMQNLLKRAFKRTSCKDFLYRGSYSKSWKITRTS